MLVKLLFNTKVLSNAISSFHAIQLVFVSCTIRPELAVNSGLAMDTAKNKYFYQE